LNGIGNVPGILAKLLRLKRGGVIDGNVACFGGRVSEPTVAREALAVFLSTPFEGGRHADRVTQLDRLI
jgi:ribose 5-phosphate isomerase RpiB